MSKSPTVVDLGAHRQQRRRPPELDLDVEAPTDRLAAGVEAKHIIPDDKPRLVLAAGAGNTGKSLLLRWIAERAIDAKRPLAMGTLAPNRTLVRYFKDTQVPTGNSTGAHAAFFESFMNTVAASRTSAVLDFPGDDTAMPHLLDQGVDPVAVMETDDVEVVGLYPVSPRVEDLTTLKQHRAKGFRPKATAIILNTGLGDPTISAELQFQAVMEHSVFRSVIDAGGSYVWMPRLFSAAMIELYNGMRFSYASKANPDLGPSDIGRTHRWLMDMETAFGGVARWLP
jgi:hypothetical protein